MEDFFFLLLGGIYKEHEAPTLTFYTCFCFVGECMAIKTDIKLPDQGNCKRCGFISSQDICKACVLLEGLNKGMPKLGITKTSKATKIIINNQQNNDTFYSTPKNLDF